MYKLMVQHGDGTYTDMTLTYLTCLVHARCRCELIALTPTLHYITLHLFRYHAVRMRAHSTHTENHISLHYTTLNSACMAWHSTAQHSTAWHSTAQHSSRAQGRQTRTQTRTPSADLAELGVAAIPCV